MKPSNDREAVEAILEAVKKSGRPFYSVTYPGAGNDEEVRVRTVAEALAEVMNLDDAFVVLKDGAWLRFVLGNDPEEVLCDYTVSLEKTVDAVILPWWGYDFDPANYLDNGEKRR